MVQTSNTKSVEMESQVKTFIPTDYSDVAQAQLLAEAYSHCLCHCENIGWMTYSDGVWTLSPVEAQHYSQKLTELQWQEAENMKKNDFTPGRRGKSNADAYSEYVSFRRSSARIKATLTEAAPLLNIKATDLDLDPLILNTPGGEVRLDSGEILPHDPSNHITRITNCAPSDVGSEIWTKFLDQISCEDRAVAEFLQQFAGMAAIGKVYEERLLIALGSGGNGKSTFFNTIQNVLGSYAGTIRSELLVASNDSGKKFEFANLRGMRFVVAEELEEGKQLDTAALKHLCSTGEINAQFKGKDIFTFKPSHSTVLCTNHMPSVRAMDNGTWDRLIVVPFKGRFRNQSKEIKNYGDYLVENCGGAVLKWIIEGARKYISNDYKLQIPAVIRQETENYQEDNDWASGFIRECLILDPDQHSRAKPIFEAYEDYCKRTNTNPCSSSQLFQRIAVLPGVSKKRVSSGIYYIGVGVQERKRMGIDELLGGLFEK